MSCKILEKADCEKLGMGAYLGVADASDEAPKFIHLTYTPEGGVTDDTTKLAVVGKGLTFDSGGYSPNPDPNPNLSPNPVNPGGYPNPSPGLGNPGGYPIPNPASGIGFQRNPTLTLRRPDRARRACT